MTTAIGIDPGISGGLALLSLDRDAVASLDVWAMPTRRVVVSGKKRDVVDLHELVSLMRLLAFEAPAGVWIEDLSGRPATIRQRQRDGSFRTIAQKGQFQQGWNCCAPVMACIGAGLPYHMTTPIIWKKRLNVPADKDSARHTASRFFPEHAGLWSRVKDDGLAEAALIALYGARTR